MSSFTDTKEREKTVDFVTYFTAGTIFYVKTSGGPTINTLADLCGHSVGVEKGTTQADDATAQSTEVQEAGKPAVKCARLPGPERGQPGDLQRPARGRDGRLAGRRVHREAVERPVQADAASSYNTAPYGIAIPKGNGMSQADPRAREGADVERHVQGDP